MSYDHVDDVKEEKKLPFKPNPVKKKGIVENKEEREDKSVLVIESR